MLKDMITFLIESGLTQTEISSETGVAQSAISRLHTGDQEEVSYSNGKAIEAMFNRVRGTKKRAA